MPARSLVGRSLCPLAALFLFFLSWALSLPSEAQPVSQSVLLPNQEYMESREDIRGKVLGGWMRVNRSWVAGKWHLNPAWASLKFIADPLGSVLAVERGDS